MIRLGKSWKTTYCDKMQNHKQILMNQTYFSKSDLSFVQELKSAWIVGISGKSDFWISSPRTFLVFMENHGFEL